MSEPITLLPTCPSEGEAIRIKRSGVATECRFVHECLMQGRSTLIVVQGAEHAAQVKALLPLFEKEDGADETEPLWTQRICDFVPMIDHPGRLSGAAASSALDPFAFERRAQSQILSCLYTLTQPGPHCVLASYESLLVRHVPTSFFTSRVLSLSVNQEYMQDMILEQALAWGYQRVPMVAAPGDIAVRGDILDIFATGYAKPIRFEFFGDVIEEIRIFDADTQRSRKTVTEVSLLPISFASITHAEREAAKERVAALCDAGRLSENTHYGIKKALDEYNVRLLPAFLFEDSSLLEQWLPRDTVWFAPEEPELVNEITLEQSRLKEVLEGDEELSQPSQFALRRSGQPAPWPKFSRVHFADQLLGETADGIPLIERPIHSFEALFPEPEAKDRPWQALVEGLRTWSASYHQILLSFATVRGRDKFLHLAAQDGISPKLTYTRNEPGLYALVAPFRRGVELDWEKTLILGEDILFPRAVRVARRPTSSFQGLKSFDSLAEGDLLVHRDYGIGRFGGLHRLTVNKVTNEFLLIEYAGHDKLYVPADNLSLIQRYKGGDGNPPALDRLGGQGWKKSTEKARKAIEKIAADLVEMYAFRKVAKGFSYGPITDLYREFEATFAYEETPDQARAIQDVLDDMQRDTPMDRLICGDVGFGKTEVALRAAFRAASESRQVALLCPTTVLAEQHYQTFRSRLAGFPIHVGLLSRFVSRTKQREVIDAAAAGKVDILIGTHRLLSNDVLLPNLGLLILDEEQRFGVRHKEKLKSFKKNIDVLTLTATPIPRTLQMSMSGIRDLSVIETPPENRKPVETIVVNRDDTFLRTILLRELERKGQVFWVYNRVNGLEQVSAYVHALVPDARIAQAHGRMTEVSLENVMYRFWHREIDVLVTTAIVESGLDFPNVNTIVIDQAQMYGLGQLYQLRGRVGRSERQAYACLIVPNKDHLTPLSGERLRIIQSMDYLGAGFQLAMEDLRLRGAGNILGEVQSGQMGRVGLDMYLEMLEEAVARLKGQPLKHEVESEVNLGLAAHIPVVYIDDSRERMRYYKVLTSAQSPRERESVLLEVRDRFGPIPQELQNFVAVLNLKSVLASLQVLRADIYEDRVNLVWPEGQTVVTPDAILAFLRRREGATVHPPATVTVPLSREVPFEQSLDALRRDLQTLITDAA